MRMWHYHLPLTTRQNHIVGLCEGIVGVGDPSTFVASPQE